MNDLAQLQLSWQGCQGCGLSKTRSNVVFYRGDKTARIVLVDGAPSLSDDTRGQPLTGNVGRKLDAVLRHAGVDPNKVFAMGVVGCRPLNDLRPNMLQVYACAGRTNRMIEIVAPEVLILLGPVAARLAGHSTVEPWRGQPTEVTVRGRVYRAIITHHPLAVMNDKTLQARMTSDIRVARSMLTRTEDDDE